jgi:glycosyltransferase involved in cell wall biosynthesis
VDNIYIDGAPLQVKTPREPLNIVQVNYAFDKVLRDPDELLNRYVTLTGWSEALRGAGAHSIVVVQRFHRDARITRNGIEYVFRERRIADTAAAFDPDVAHVNGLIFPAQTWMLRRALNASCAVVVQNHADGGAVGRAPVLRLLGRAGRRSVDAFLFAAAEHVEPWRRAGLIAPDQATHLVMEASTALGPTPREVAREQTGVRGAPAILWVGRLNDNKDPLTVLAGFERALGDLPGATLTMIYSEDDLLRAVRQSVQRSPTLISRVRLVGAVPHDRMPAFYSAADLFVVGSHHEGSGYALMEACACGTVPVVTDIPTFRLLTGGPIAGALWTAGDDAALARALVNVSRRDLDAERARLTDYFERELSWSAVGRRALEIYDDVRRRRRSIRSS